MAMLIMSFFSWWYGAGWKMVFKSFGPRITAVSTSFSVRQLSRTLFSPWRRLVTETGKSLDAKMKALGDNLVSRAVGFTVRVAVLFAAIICICVVAVLSIAEMIIWPLLPLAAPACIAAGILLL